ncbi:hypothetical protein [Mycobacterium sp. 050134]|uniref:hypothetical protein n=1 Tax=Mycobacterium sp. 050134 TaxID=3096111 RepID=UPI002EDA3620
MMPTLSADVARSGASTREAYERKIAALAGRVAEVLDAASETADRLISPGKRRK